MPSIWLDFLNIGWKSANLLSASPLFLTCVCLFMLLNDALSPGSWPSDEELGIEELPVKAGTVEEAVMELTDNKIQMIVLE